MALGVQAPGRVCFQVRGLGRLGLLLLVESVARHPVQGCCRVAAMERQGSALVALADPPPGPVHYRVLGQAVQAPDAEGMPGQWSYATSLRSVGSEWWRRQRRPSGWLVNANTAGVRAAGFAAAEGSGQARLRAIHLWSANRLGWLATEP